MTKRLHALVVSSFRLFLIAEENFRVPAYRGALFRGGFGEVFREISCITGAPTCIECPHIAHCNYSQIFETPLEPGQVSVLKKGTNAPHPFVLSPVTDDRTTVPSGSAVLLDVLLIHPQQHWFPQFLFALDEMGRRGKYGGRFRVETVTSGVDGRVLFNGRQRRILDDPPLVHWNLNDEATEKIRIDLITPLRMKTGGTYNNNPDFVALFHSLLRRIHLLTVIYGRQPAETEWMRDLLRQADDIVTELRSFSMFRWDRMSGRQHRRIAMDGVVGSFTARGNLGPLLPFLRAGELLHIGSGTSMGLGKYRLEVEA